MLADLLAFIAQQTTTQPAKPTGPSGLTTLIGIMLFFGVFMWMMRRGQRREQRERQSLLDSLAKNDRVMTVGGIMGTIVNVRETEVVVKVDESSNTKMTFRRTAIQQVFKDGESS